eukprot:CAMPEP_0117479782 /NCGR_PEP_ID=MMETSP0784-20121206/12060_1 /TAXON_ID=39447 /ORGANISM="" /LENGTH=880 /DNA_ID=CAMNT_0005274215 /DNA_START=8 /DNA_END=2647 /DNA_ORIENTATION=-
MAMLTGFQAKARERAEELLRLCEADKKVEGAAAHQHLDGVAAAAARSLRLEGEHVLRVLGRNPIALALIIDIIGLGEAGACSSERSPGADVGTFQGSERDAESSEPCGLGPQGVAGDAPMPQAPSERHLEATSAGAVPPEEASTLKPAPDPAAVAEPPRGASPPEGVSSAPRKRCRSKTAECPQNEDVCQSEVAQRAHAVDEKDVGGIKGTSDRSATPGDAAPGPDSMGVPAAVEKAPPRPDKDPQKETASRGLATSPVGLSSTPPRSAGAARDGELQFEHMDNVPPSTPPLAGGVCSVEPLLESVDVVSARQHWVRAEVRMFLLECAGLKSATALCEARVTAASLQRLLADQTALPWLQRWGVLQPLKAEIERLGPNEQPMIDQLLDRVLVGLPYVLVPFTSDFQEATPEEVAGFPHLCKLFYNHQQRHSKNSHWKEGVKLVFRHFIAEWRSPKEMAREAYRVALKYTLVDMKGRRAYSCALAHFAEFWHAEGRFASAPDAEQAEQAAKEWRLPAERKPRREKDEPGDSSAEARASEPVSLPEGWAVHRRASGERLGYTSPGRRLYSTPQEARPRLGYLPNLSKARKTRTEPCVEPTPEKRSRVAPCSTADPASGESAEAACPQTLDDLLGPPAEHERTSERDRLLLPRVLATFERYLGQVGALKQTTRDCYICELVRLFTVAGRNFDAMAEQRFLDGVCQSKENRARHNLCSSALRQFRTFWLVRGGYEGAATLDEANRELLNRTLNVRPALEDLPIQCNLVSDSGSVCQRPRQRCATCGSSFRCARHTSHSREECREIFWATHSTNGSSLRTLKDFFNGAKREAARSITCRCCRRARSLATSSSIDGLGNFAALPLGRRGRRDWERGALNGSQQRAR